MFTSSRSLTVWTLCFLLCARSSAADSAKDKSKSARRTCPGAYASALELEQDGKLRQARDELLFCARSPCGGFVQQQCVGRYTQLEADIPSVVPLVTSEEGDPRVDVQVSIDNELLTSRLDGRSLPVDPGVHEFSFASEGKILATQKVLILQGQRNRPISVELKSDKPALNAKSALDKPPAEKSPFERRGPEVPPPDKPAPRDTAPAKAATDAREREPVLLEKSGRGAVPYVLGAVGLVGLGGAGLLTYWGRKDNELLVRCAPDCPKESLDHIQRLYLASDVSLGVGAAALATGLVWFLTSGPPKDDSRARTGYRLDVHPTASGGLATLSGSF